MARQTAFFVKHLQPEHFGVFAPELKHVTHFDAAFDSHWRATHRAGVVVAHVSNIGHTVSGKIATTHQVDDVAAGCICASDPGGVGYDARVKQVSNAKWLCFA